MQQSVNFINALPKIKNRLPIILVIAVMIVLLVILFIISITMSVNVYRAYSNMEQVEDRYDVVNESYIKLAKQYPLLVSDTPLINQIDELEKRYAEKHAQFASIIHFIIRPGFSKYMIGLAQVTPNTLWLKQISIDHNTTNVTLSGYALRPDSVTELMAHLLEINPFHKVLFSSFYVRALKSRSYVSFSISTHDLAITENATEESGQESSEEKT